MRRTRGSRRRISIWPAPIRRRGSGEDAARELGVFRALKANPLETLEKRNELERDLWRQAEALLLEGREAEALELLTRSNVKGDVPEFLVGALDYRLGRLADAERLLTKAAASAPDTPNVRTFLALTYTETGRLDEAAALLAAELEKNPREPLVLMALGQLSFRRKSWAEAARYLQESKVVVPAALLMLCEAQLELGQRPAAQERPASSPLSRAAAPRPSPCSSGSSSASGSRSKASPWPHAR